MYRRGRHPRPGDASGPSEAGDASGHDRWVINKIRALTTWFSKGLDGGSHLRTEINRADSLASLRGIIAGFFAAPPLPEPDPPRAGAGDGAVRLS